MGGITGKTLLLLGACVAPEHVDPVVDPGGDTGPVSGDCEAELWDTVDASAPAQVAPEAWPICSETGPRGFEEVGAAWGFVAHPFPEPEHATGGVVAALDWDRDGDLDLVAGFAQDGLHVLENTGTGFVSVDQAARVEGRLPVSVADMDGDGWLDVVASGPRAEVYWGGPDGLERERFDHDLVQAAQEFAPVDIDGDGVLDLFVAAAGPVGDPDVSSRQDVWFRGLGDRAFEVQALALTGGQGFDAVVSDLDADGDPDVYVVNDFGAEHEGNWWWRNDGGTLVESASGTGLDLVVSGMGGATAFLDPAGLPWVFISATGTNHLMQPLDDGSYVDVGASTGANTLGGLPEMSWGAIFWDHDDDGREDLVIAHGDLWYDGSQHTNIWPAPVSLLVNEGGPGAPVFVDRAAELGIDVLGSWRAVLPADFDGDGQIDLLVTDVEQRTHLWRATGCTGNGAIRFSAPEGTRVSACVAGQRQERTVTHQSGWGASHPPWARLGLGQAEAAELVVLRTPDGQVFVAEDVPARAVVGPGAR